MKKLLTVIFIFISIFAYAENKPNLSPMELYHENYFITGDKEDYAKFQVSAKFALLKHYESGLFLSYTQISFWDIWSASSPFRENNYSPSVFIKSEDFLSDYLNYIQFGMYEHMSNGEDHADNRSIDRGYVETQWSYGTKLNIGINAKGLWYYGQAKENKEYASMSKYYTVKFFISFGEQTEENAKDELYVKVSGWNKGYQEYGIISRKLPFMNPRLYVQVYHGYLESMINYNKCETKIRAGLIFK